jgi:hypothetical protein
MVAGLLGTTCQDNWRETVIPIRGAGGEKFTDGRAIFVRGRRERKKKELNAETQRSQRKTEAE